MSRSESVSIIINASVRVPGGIECLYENGQPCDFMEHCPTSNAYYCSVFNGVELIQIPGGESYLKAGACLKARKEAEDE